MVINMEIEKDTIRKIGKYTVVKSLGEGGEGSVYLARDETLQRLVAVKRIRKPDERKVQDWDGKEDRIIQEADFLQRLKHPMLPVVYDLLWDDTWYLVMEYIPGYTLHEYIERNGCVQEKTACAWAGQLLDILEYLHTRKPPVIYRDLKPDNIMVCPEGHLKLVDFGAADLHSFGSGTTELMAATPGYSAPEQFGMYQAPERNKSIAADGYAPTGAYADERSDFYAFGKVLYYMITGAEPSRPPYASLPVRNYQPLAGERIEQIIRKCIRDNPSKRYQVAEEIRRDLEECKRGRAGAGHRRSFIKVIEKKVWLTESYLLR